MSSRMVASQAIILRYIRKNPDCTANQIAEHSDVAYSTVNRNLLKLRDDGLVEVSGSVYNKGIQVRTYKVVE